MATELGKGCGAARKSEPSGQSGAETKLVRASRTTNNGGSVYVLYLHWFFLTN